MIFNLQKVNSLGKKSLTGKWFTCTIICDKCGKEIYPGVLWASQPDFNSKNYCFECSHEKNKKTYAERTN